jgi:hypothetical protein
MGYMKSLIIIRRSNIYTEGVKRNERFRSHQKELKEEEVMWNGLEID